MTSWYPPDLRPGRLAVGWRPRRGCNRRLPVADSRRTRDSVTFAALADLCTRGRVGLQTGQQALACIAVILAAKGGTDAEVRVERITAQTGV